MPEGVVVDMIQELQVDLDLQHILLVDQVEVEMVEMVEMEHQVLIPLEEVVEGVQIQVGLVEMVVPVL
jgi:uncharacterized protein (UPF0179 family)